MKKSYFLPIFITALAAQLIITEVFDLSRFITTPLFFGALYFLCRYFDFNKNDLGISKPSKKVIAWSLVVFLFILGSLGAVYFIAPDVLKDKRYNQSLSATIVSIFIILPLTTVLLEELAFRGMLLGYYLKNNSKKLALIVSSVIFGLWHIPSSLHINIDAFLFIDHPSQLLVSLAIVLVTAFAGFIFSLLRLKTSNLLVPVVAHWSLNALAIFFAYLAWQP